MRRKSETRESESTFAGVFTAGVGLLAGLSMGTGGLTLPIAFLYGLFVKSYVKKELTKRADSITSDNCDRIANTFYSVSGKKKFDIGSIISVPSPLTEGLFINNTRLANVKRIHHYFP